MYISKKAAIEIHGEAIFQLGVKNTLAHVLAIIDDYKRDFDPNDQPTVHRTADELATVINNVIGDKNEIRE